MALTRKFLTAMGIEADKVDEIIEAHAETVNALKAERDELKGNADKVAELQTQLDQANKTIEAQGTDEFKGKYDELLKEFDAYKAEQSEKETVLAKESAYKALLKEAGVSEKRIETIMKVTNLNDVELVDGKIKDSDTLMDNMKTEWADFITADVKEGAKTQNPPAGDEGAKAPATIPTIF